MKMIEMRCKFHWSNGLCSIDELDCPFEKEERQKCTDFKEERPIGGRM